MGKTWKELRCPLVCEHQPLEAQLLETLGAAGAGQGNTRVEAGARSVDENHGCLDIQEAHRVCRLKHRGQTHSRDGMGCRDAE